MSQVLAAFRQLDPHPDVAAAFQMLHQAGVPAVTLSNGGTELVQLLLDLAALAGHVRRCLSVDATPLEASEPYQYADAELGVEPNRLALVAAHRWDCASAHQSA